MPLFRRSANPDGVMPRRPHAGLLRRERRALVQAREAELRDLGGLLVEMYRRGGFRDDLLAARAATVVGIDVRLAGSGALLPSPGRVVRVDGGDPVRRAS